MCLLPHLRCLSLAGACTKKAIFFCLVSPQHSHFKLRIAGNVPVSFAALDTLCKTSRLLTALDLTCIITQETFIELCEIPNLQYFLLKNGNFENSQPLIIRNNFFHSLEASSETLYHLALRGSLVFLLEDSPPLEQLTFPILKRFEISFATDVVSHIPRLFSTARLPTLERLDIEIKPSSHQSISPLSWDVFWGSIQSFRTSRLRSLTLCHLCPSSRHDCFEFQFSTLLDSLWGSLEELSITGPILKPITPTDWSKFLSSQKALKYLFLSHRQSNQFGVMGFNAMLDLAMNMEHLENLAIFPDFETIPRFTDVPILNHKLRSVDFLGAPLQDPLNFGQALDRIFPHVELIIVKPYYFNYWAKVRSIQKSLQRARQDQDGISPAF